MRGRGEAGKDKDKLSAVGEVRHDSDEERWGKEGARGEKRTSWGGRQGGGAEGRVKVTAQESAPTQPTNLRPGSSAIKRSQIQKNEGGRR